MMVKSRLEFILKLTEPLQRYLLTCQANSALLGRFFCTGQQQLWRGSVKSKINSTPLFTIIFKLKNVNFKTREFNLLIEWVLAGVSSQAFGGPRSRLWPLLSFVAVIFDASAIIDIAKKSKIKKKDHNYFYIFIVREGVANSYLYLCADFPHRSWCYIKWKGYWISSISFCIHLSL